MVCRDASVNRSTDVPYMMYMTVSGGVCGGLYSSGGVCGITCEGTVCSSRKILCKPSENPNAEKNRAATHGEPNREEASDSCYTVEIHVR